MAAMSVTGTAVKEHSEPLQQIDTSFKTKDLLNTCSGTPPDHDTPPCENCNNDPGVKAGIAGPQCRTSEQVAADCKAKHIAILAEVKRGEDARRRLAELQLQEEHDTRHQSQQVHQKCLAQKNPKATGSSNESKGESFDFAEVDAMSTLSDETEAPKKVIPDTCLLLVSLTYHGQQPVSEAVKR